MRIVLQRVPEFGFDYLHQPRYTLFYQLHLAALAVLLYRNHETAKAAAIAGGKASEHKLRAALLAATVLLAALLQHRLSTLAWEQSKYLSTYLAGAARTMGEIARNPHREGACADILTVCQFPPAKRRELLDRLVRYRLNVFSPEFQAFHLLYPERPPEVAENP